MTCTANTPIPGTPARRPSQPTWTEQSVEDALRGLAEDLGHYPQAGQMRVRYPSLYGAARRYRSHEEWRALIGAKVKDEGKEPTWTPERVEETLRKLCAEFGYYPSAAQMRVQHSGLYGAAGKIRPHAQWRALLGVDQAPRKPPARW